MPRAVRARCGALLRRIRSKLHSSHPPQETPCVKRRSVPRERVRPQSHSWKVRPGGMGSVPPLRDALAHSRKIPPEGWARRFPGSTPLRAFLYSAQEAWAQLAAAHDAAAQEAWAQLAEFQEADAQLACAHEAWAQLAEFHGAHAQVAFV